MIEQNEISLEELKKIISKEKKVVKEMVSFFKDLEETKDKEEKRMIVSHMNQLKNSLEKINMDIPEILEKIILIRPLHPQKIEAPQPQPVQKTELTMPVKQIPSISNIQKVETLKKTKEISDKSLIGSIFPKKKNILKLEKETLKRLKEKGKEVIKPKIKKASQYVKTANEIFSNLSTSIQKKKIIKLLEKDLLKTNLQFILSSYISLILLTTFLSIILGIFIFLFFLFFSFANFPLITRVSEEIGVRFLKIFWILFVIPIATLLFTYFYPALEKKSIENKINRELPFAAINMSAISGSMIDLSKIFSIIIATKEYPNLEKEFTKLINQINIYGYDIVTALKKIAANTPSKKLAELFIGLATTINSGGDLTDFFDKRAQTLLFEYRIEREKRTKFSETFMDIYISAVIAAPMILMLVLMMMKISGLGIALSTSMITLIMVLSVTLINIVFLTFLHLKQPAE